MASTKISALTTFTGNTTGVYVVIDNSGLTQTYKISIDALLSSLSGITTTNDVRGRYLISTNATGDEGGEINLAKPPTSTLSGGTTIDAYQDRLRFFEQGGNARGAYLDMAKLPTGVGAELLTKASGLVNAGVDVTLGNLKARIPTSGNRSLQLSTVTGTYSVYGSGVYTAGGVGTGFIDGSTPLSVTTTPAYLAPSNNFSRAGYTDQWLIMDTGSNISWRISMIIGVSYNNNMITIERLV